jgi:hypothetical protein
MKKQILTRGVDASWLSPMISIESLLFRFFIPVSFFSFLFAQLSLIVVNGRKSQSEVLTSMSSPGFKFEGMVLL